MRLAIISMWVLTFFSLLKGNEVELTLGIVAWILLFIAGLIMAIFQDIKELERKN